MKTRLPKKSSTAIFQRKQSGFSLIELLLVVVVFGFLFTIIARVMLTTIKSDARLTEQSESATRNASITDLLQTDLSNPLRLLTGSSGLASSTTFAPYFESHNDYNFGSGVVERRQQTGTEPAVSSLILPEGEAQAKFFAASDATVTVGWQTLGEAASRKSIQLARVGGGENTRQYSILTGSGGSQDDGSLSGNLNNFEIRIEKLSVGCQVGFYSVFSDEKMLLARTPCPAMSVELTVQIAETGGFINNLLLSGAFATRGDGIRRAPLPYVGTAQISIPIFLNAENGDLVVFRADQATDKTFSTSASSFAPQQTTKMTVKKPPRGTYQANDYVFVVDYQSYRSVVARVVSTAAAGSDTIFLSVLPSYTATDAAWGLFYSRPADFQYVSFQPGSEIVHLAAPVSYRFLPADRLLIRREGSGLFETVAPGVSAFNVGLSDKALRIELLTTTEGIETYNDQPSQTTRINIPIR